MNRDRDATGLGALSAYLTAQAAAKKDAEAPRENAVAPYLALGGAHISITKTGDVGVYDDDEGESYETTVFAATCESCGPLKLVDRYKVDYYRPSGQPYHGDAVAHAETTARKHAETCRRIPERLWLEDGA